jgi:hypothetical protein
MITKKLALAAALMAASTAFAAQHEGKSDQGQSAQSASTNQPAPSTEAAAPSAPAAQPMPSYEQTPKAAKAAGDESVRQLQQALKDKGFDPGPVDGVMGPRTQAAMDQAKSAGATIPGVASSAEASTSSASASTNQPSSSESQPSASTNQPSASTNQPAASTNQPAASTADTSQQSKQ